MARPTVRWDTDPTDTKGIELTKRNRTVLTLKVGDCINYRKNGGNVIGVISMIFGNYMDEEPVGLEVYTGVNVLMNDEPIVEHLRFSDNPDVTNSIKHSNRCVPVPNVQRRAQGGKRRTLRHRRRQRTSRRN